MKNTISAILLFAYSTIIFSAQITVGTDSCDETTIQSAINSAKIDPNINEIRVASNGTYNENILIGNQSLIIRGGYVDCASAIDENPASRTGQTTITGMSNAESPVIRITGDSALHSIVLDSLTLTGGTKTSAASNFSGGGLSVYHSWSNIEIINSSISGNTGTAGGGIAIEEGLNFTRLDIIDTLIFANFASVGGGIFCAGIDSSVLMQGASGVSLNNATIGQGGGLYMTQGCDFTSYSGTDGNGGGFDIQGILGNNSIGSGGGIYANLASQITLYGHENCSATCIGNNTNPANLTSNHSGSDGGGAYITGVNTALKIYAGLVNGNTADGDGGAIYVNNAASFLTERLASECWDQDHCNHYINNKAGTSSGKGGMIYNALSTINISHAVIENNRADFGAVIAAEGTPTISILKSNIIHHNGDNGADGFSDNHVFSILSGSKIDVSHSTIADNNVNLSVFNIPSVSVGDSDLFASIVDGDINTPVFAGSQSNNIFVTCMMLHEMSSIPNTQLFTTVDDAEFVDRANGDYHLNPLLSPAIDYCDDSAGPSNYKDIDFESYGTEYPIDNEFGPYDLGADEVYPTHTLTVSTTGNGTITSNPIGIDCGVSTSDCTEDYVADTQVTLNAISAIGYSFDSWSGACTGSGSNCTVTMDQAKNTTAIFTANFYLLSVTVTGSGTVTSNPGGIDCGSDCFQAYTPNTSVTLIATPDIGNVFVEWTGGCSGSSACVINMNAGKNVRALFVLATTYTLSTTVSGNGTITSNPKGINCGVDCTEDYADNTSVTLTATPMSGFNFVNWSGDCSGSASCVVNMSKNRTVRANFTANEFTLTTVVVGNGTITSNPAGINCESDCTQDYANNTTVTLTASPMAGNNFTGWTGDCTGTGPCDVSMTQDRNVSATFSAADELIFSSGFE